MGFMKIYFMFNLLYEDLFYHEFILQLQRTTNTPPPKPIAIQVPCIFQDPLRFLFGCLKSVLLLLLKVKNSSTFSIEKFHTFTRQILFFGEDYKNSKIFSFLNSPMTFYCELCIIYFILPLPLISLLVDWPQIVSYPFSCFRSSYFRHLQI